MRLRATLTAVLVLALPCADWAVPPEMVTWNTSGTRLLAYGDSKTWLMGWQPLLVTSLISGAAIVPVDTIAQSGASVADMKARVDADIASFGASAAVSDILIDLGINEVSDGLPTEAAWKADALYIMDAFHTRWPGAHVYLARVWFNQDHEADIVTINGWIGDVVAARAAWASVGHNEAVWLEGGDNGVTMTSDGVHYSAAGNAQCAAQWKTVLGL